MSKSYITHIVYSDEMRKVGSLDWDILWVWVVLPVGTKVWDLGVEGVSEQWDTVSEGGDSSKTTETPESQVQAVGLSSSQVNVRFSNLVGWSSDVSNHCCVR